VNGYIWKITVGNAYVGLSNTEDRFKLLEEAVVKGIIPADYKLTDVKMEIIKNERTNSCIG